MQRFDRMRRLSVRQATSVLLLSWYALWAVWLYPAHERGVVSLDAPPAGLTPLVSTGSTLQSTGCCSARPQPSKSYPPKNLGRTCALCKVMGQTTMGQPAVVAVPRLGLLSTSILGLDSQALSIRCDRTIQGRAPPAAA
jgi:hypothetical protein